MIWGTPQAPIHTKTISYSYNDLNELVSMVYPSGREIKYYYTNAGKINKIDLVENGVTTTLISSIAYGYTTLVKKFNTNNGLTLDRVVHDFTGRPTWDNLQDEVTGVKLIPAHNIYYNDNGSVERQEWWASHASNGYTYDTFQKVLTRTGVNPNITENFTYDDIGNITSRTVNGVLSAYNYSPGTNRLASINGGNPRTFTYNGQGFIANDSGRVLSFNGYKLMNGVTIGSAIYKYTYSPLGNKRIIKQKNSDPATFYLYGLDDHPIEEFKGIGLLVDYFYLYDTPIAIEKGVGEIYFVHVAPENNAPVAMYDINKNVVWSANYDAFGKANIVNSTVELNLRSIGQYFDVETGYHYNKARYYDPGIGKYLQPDPIGLIAGTNIYAYVGNNPINRVDPDGLETDYFNPGGPFRSGVGGPWDRNHSVPASKLIGSAAEGIFAGGGVRSFLRCPPVTKSGAESAKQAANLREHLRQAEKYGQGGIKELENGRIRYYGGSVAPTKQGEMAGWRTVREWDPATGQKRTWHETLDHTGNVRQVRPVTDGTKTHYTFDKDGNYTGSW